jgi:hypothetical protein
MANAGGSRRLDGDLSELQSSNLLFNGMNEQRKQQEAEEVRRITAAREEDLLAGVYPDIQGVLPGTNVVDASGYAINAKGIKLGAEIDDGSMDYDSYEYSYRYATHIDQNLDLPQLLQRLQPEGTQSLALHEFLQSLVLPYSRQSRVLPRLKELHK